MKELLGRIKENLTKSKLDLSIFISCIIVAVLCIILLVILLNREEKIDNKIVVKESSATDAVKETAAEKITEVLSEQATDNSPENGTNNPTRLKADITMSGEWGSEGEQFMQYDINLTNVSKETIPDWKLVISFTKDITISQGWGGEFTSEGNELTILPADYTKEIPPEELRNIGLIISSENYAYAAKYTVIIGDFSETVELEYKEEETTARTDENTSSTSNTSNTPQQENTQTPQGTQQGTPQGGTQQETSQSSTQQQPVSAVTGFYSEHGALHVSGTAICDSNGNPFQIKGVSTHGIAWFPEYVNREAFSSLKDFGVNTVRFAMYTNEYNGYCSGGDQNSLKNLVKEGVGYATELGMYAIIDWHILSDGNPNTHINEAIAFFDEMSRTYASYGNVLYEICNEPNGGVAWSDGSGYDIKTYAEQVIRTIRANDSDAIIIVGTPTWSQDVDVVSNSPITGYDNLVYALHFYAATHKDDIRNKARTAISSGLPLLVSEFSICDASGNGWNDTSSANEWLDLLNSNSIGYVAWSFSNKAESSALINSGCSKTSGFSYDDFSESGKWFLGTLN